MGISGPQKRSTRSNTMHTKPSHHLTNELRRIFRTGNQLGMQAFFDAVYQAAGSEFREDTRQALDLFLKEKIDKASAEFWGKTE